MCPTLYPCQTFIRYCCVAYRERCFRQPLPAQKPRESRRTRRSFCRTGDPLRLFSVCSFVVSLYHGRLKGDGVGWACRRPQRLAGRCSWPCSTRRCSQEQEEVENVRT